MSLPIGFFSPLPLPIMVPFMFMQSAAMALGFGSFFQYGKRKISSMSNEEFNALTPEALTAQLLSNVNNMIPSVQQSFKQMEQMNVLILDAMANYFSQGVAKLDQWIRGRGENLVSNLGQGAEDISQGISDFFLPQASAAEYVPPEDLRKLSNERITFGPTGPQQPSLDPLYAQLTLHQRYTMWKTNSPTWKRMPNTQKVIIIRSLKNYKPKTATQGIASSGATGVVKQIALQFNQIVSMLKGTMMNTPNHHQYRGYITFLLNAMKAYNRLVTLNRKPNLQIDTAKSLRAKRIIPK